MAFKFSNIILWINTFLTFWIGAGLAILFLLALAMYAGFQEIEGNLALAFVVAGGILITIFGICVAKWQKYLMNGKSIITQLALLALLIFLFQIFQPEPFVYVLN